LVVWRLDALAPTLHDVIVRVIELHQRGMKMLSLSEPLNTAPAEGVWIVIAFAALRACERNLLIERTHQGRIKARASGMRTGPKLKLSSQQIAQALALLEEGQSRDNVADLLRVSRSTLYRAAGTEASRVTAASSTG
jgi:DNA invertase Pin-like site-specific DNA recombinase